MAVNAARAVSARAAFEVTMERNLWQRARRGAFAGCLALLSVVSVARPSDSWSRLDATGSSIDTRGRLACVASDPLEAAGDAALLWSLRGLAPGAVAAALSSLPAATVQAAAERYIEMILDETGESTGEFIGGVAAEVGVACIADRGVSKALAAGRDPTTGGGKARSAS